MPLNLKTLFNKEPSFCSNQAVNFPRRVTINIKHVNNAQTDGRQCTGKGKTSAWSQQKEIRRRLLILDQFARDGCLGEIFEVGWTYLVLFSVITIWKAKPAERPGQRLLRAPADRRGSAHSVLTDSWAGSRGTLSPHAATGKGPGLFLFTPQRWRKAIATRGWNSGGSSERDL